MNPRITYFLGLALLLIALVLAYLNMAGQNSFGSRYTPLLAMVAGLILILKARRASR